MFIYRFLYPFCICWTPRQCPISSYLTITVSSFAYFFPLISLNFPHCCCCSQSCSPTSCFPIIALDATYFVIHVPLHVIYSVNELYQTVFFTMLCRTISLHLSFTGLLVRFKLRSCCFFHSNANPVLNSSSFDSVVPFNVFSPCVAQRPALKLLRTPSYDTQLIYCLSCWQRSQITCLKVIAILFCYYLLDWYVR